ncbi:hypothetical protein Tco_0535317 [Tanacetum coccineum]
METMDLSNSWDILVDQHASKVCSHSIGSFLIRIVLSTAVYNIWKERNARVFTGEVKDDWPWEGSGSSLFGLLTRKMYHKEGVNHCEGLAMTKGVYFLASDACSFCSLYHFGEDVAAMGDLWDK